MRIIFLFLDGVGIGKADPAVNPFFQARLPHLALLLGEKMPHLRLRRISSRAAEVVPLNATLGIPGLPQSGTGQATLFTGVNAPKLIGRHFGPHPTTTLHQLIEERNIFRQIKSTGRSVCFANAFPKQFFDYVASGTRRLSVTTLSCRYAGVELLQADSLSRDSALSADITRARWPDLGYPALPTITPREAGKQLWRISSRHSFTLFEYWLTDYAGHSKDMPSAVESLERFDGMLGGLLEDFKADECTLIITSDHGNIEDLSTKSHTRNPVPCILAGQKRGELSAVLKTLADVTPALLALF